MQEVFEGRAGSGAGQTAERRVWWMMDEGPSSSEADPVCKIEHLLTGRGALTIKSLPPSVHK